jgi:DNA polymerase sigma
VTGADAHFAPTNTTAVVVSRCHEAIRQMLLHIRQQHPDSPPRHGVNGGGYAVNSGSGTSGLRLASAQMLQLADATAMGEEDGQRRAAVLELVSRLLASAFPPAVSLHCFGSSANGLGTSDSDLDIHLGEQK